ncbi:MAG TPA: YggT family protein [Caulobacteraceae bacterium]|jgi:YggT family protein
MSAILYFIFLVIGFLLDALVWLIVANAIISWLVAFDIINLRNRAAYSVVRMIDRVTAPFLAPFRRFIPPIGGMDITPVILIVLIMAAQRALLPALFLWLQATVGGGVPT